jgi:hypothetical protein
MRVYGKFCGATVYINQHAIKLDFIVCDLNIGCDLLLGQPFLKHYRAHIEPAIGVCVLDVDGEPVVIGEGVTTRVQNTAHDNDSTTSTLAGAITTFTDNCDSTDSDLHDIATLLSNAAADTDSLSRQLQATRDTALHTYRKLAVLRPS